MRRLLTFVLLLGLSATAAAEEYAVEKLDEAAPEDEISSDIAEVLSPTGLRITEDGEPLCDIWLVKQWEAQADFTPSIALMYPLTHGQLLGVIRWEDDADDFRGQEVDDGVYTLRFALQPEDGNHIGTSDTRDFLLMLPADDDESADVLADEDLLAMSADAVGSTHPAMLALLAPGEGGAEEASIQHDEGRELWSVRFANPTAEGKPLVMNIVFIGRAAE